MYSPALRELAQQADRCTPDIGQAGTVPNAQ
jgi:hypothetical protein